MDAFAALADPVRRSILRQLVAGPARVVDLAAAYAISRPAVSRHLRLLSKAGLVVGEDRGRERHYRLEPRPLTPVAELVEVLTTSRRLPTPEATLDALDTEVKRTSRQRRTPGTRRRDTA